MRSETIRDQWRARKPGRIPRVAECCTGKVSAGPSARTRRENVSSSTEQNREQLWTYEIEFACAPFAPHHARTKAVVCGVSTRTSRASTIEPRQLSALDPLEIAWEEDTVRKRDTARMPEIKGRSVELGAALWLALGVDGTLRVEDLKHGRRFCPRRGVVCNRCVFCIGGDTSDDLEVMLPR